jgi:hypothetical protein
MSLGRQFRASLNNPLVKNDTKPGGTNSDRTALAALFHSLLMYSPPPNRGVCASTRLQTLVFPPGLGYE